MTTALGRDRAVPEQQRLEEVTALAGFGGGDHHFPPILRNFPSEQIVVFTNKARGDQALFKVLLGLARRFGSDLILSAQEPTSFSGPRYSK